MAQDVNSNRQFIIGGFFVLVTIIYVIRLFALQITETKYQISAENNARRHVTEYPARGLIFDRNGELLVYNQAQYDLMIVPKQTKEFDTLELCEILGTNIETLKNNINKARKYSLYKPSIVFKQISALRYAELQEKLYKFQGFFIQTHSTRIYKQDIASHFLGYVGEVNRKKLDEDAYYKAGDYVGISGIEKAYEKILRGKKGLSIFLVDVHNRVKGSYKEGKYDTSEVVGSDIYTTIDVELQKYGEKLMQNKRGSIVAIEPATGEVLALISSPYYAPNLLTGNKRSQNYLALASSEDKPLFNRALMAFYPPGSTLKPIQALIGMQEGVITSESVFPCNGGFSIGTHVVGCHHVGNIGLIHSIAGSCNSYYCGVFTKILHNDIYPTSEDAYQNWRSYLHSFGLGVKLKSDLGHELSGILYPSNYFNKYYGRGRWGPFTIISLSIGQGELGFTPIQIANMVSVIANRGYYIIPHSVRRIGGQAEINEKFKEKHYVNIEQKYFEPVITGMQTVLEFGTAGGLALPNITICGKTGTAQNPHGTDHSIFVAFAPKNEPKIAISVYVENGGYGSTWAAPIATLMIEKYLSDSISKPWLEQKMIQGNLMNN